MNILMIPILFLFSFGEVEAQEFRYLGRSPKGLLMGDAYTAVVKDEFSLFYNPASLGRNYGAEINPVNFTFAVTNALDDLDRFKDFPSDAVDIAERVMDFPLYLQLSGAPGFKMGGFGFTLFANSTTSISLQNSVNPILNVDYRYDSGFIMGYAVNLTSRGPGLVGMSSRQGHRLTIGASVKHIKREGIDESFNFFGTRILNALENADDFSSIRRNLGYSKGKAWGVDFGLEYGHKRGPSELTLGLSLLDILDTRFKKTDGEVNLPDQKMNLSFGSAWKQDFGLFDYVLSFDLHPLLESYDYRQKMHFGAKVGLPMFDVFAGWSGGYLSYGGSLKLWPLNLTAGIYANEIGVDYGDSKGNRFILYLSLLETNFSF